jgi:hypothetical protein
MQGYMGLAATVAGQCSSLHMLADINLSQQLAPSSASTTNQDPEWQRQTMLCSGACPGLLCAAGQSL